MAFRVSEGARRTELLHKRVKGTCAHTMLPRASA